MFISLDNKLLSLLNYLMLAVFILALAVQYNDPDSMIWMVVYGLAAIVCCLASMNQLHWMLPATISVSVLIWGIILVLKIEGGISFYDLFLSSWTMKSHTVELMREVGGLTIVLFWMITLSLSNNPLFINFLNIRKLNKY